VPLSHFLVNISAYRFMPSLFFFYLYPLVLEFYFHAFLFMDELLIFSHLGFTYKTYITVKS